MSTNVLWAGNVSGQPVVSIFNNPTANVGGNDPLLSPYDFIDRIYFDSRFNYLSVATDSTFVKQYEYIPATGSSTEVVTTSTILIHNLGYIPAAMLIDRDTNEVIGANHYVQIENNQSYRIISLLMDSTKFYIKEKYYAKNYGLPAITRRYRILGFDNLGSTPTP